MDLLFFHSVGYIPRIAVKYREASGVDFEKTGCFATLALANHEDKSYFGTHSTKFLMLQFH